MCILRWKGRLVGNSQEQEDNIKNCKTSTIGHEDIISLAWPAYWSSRDIHDHPSRWIWGQSGVLVSSDALHPATDDLSHQDPLLHQHGSQPTRIFWSFILRLVIIFKTCFVLFHNSINQHLDFLQRGAQNLGSHDWLDNMWKRSL